MFDTFVPEDPRVAALSNRIERVRVAGSKPGDTRYEETRRLMKDSIPDDGAWFHPRFEREGDNGKEQLVFENTTLFIAGEKL